MPDGYIQKTERLSEAPVYAMDAWYRDEEHKNRIIDALQDLCLMNPHGKSPTMDATIQGEDKGRYTAGSDQKAECADRGIHMLSVMV
jgi:hypothetical protein